MMSILAVITAMKRDLARYREAVRLFMRDKRDGVQEGIVAAAFSEQLEDEELDRCLRALVHAGWLIRERGWLFPGQNFKSTGRNPA